MKIKLKEHIRGDQTCTGERIGLEGGKLSEVSDFVV